MGSFSQVQLSIKDTWLSALGLYRKVILKTWPVGLIIGIIVIASLLFGAIYGTETLRGRIIAIVVPLAMVFIVMYLTSMMLCQIYNLGNNQAFSFKEITKTINQRYLKIVFSMLLVLLAYSVGILLLILPGIFIFVSFLMVQPLVLFDNRNVLEALKESFQLVLKCWWRVFVVILPLMLVNYWLSFSVGYAYSQHNWWLLGSDLLLSVLFYPLFYSCILVIFHDLKLRRGNNVAM